MKGGGYRRIWDFEVDTSGMDDSIERLANSAACICDDIRNVDPVELHRQLTLACQQEPARFAQVLMVLAAWVNPEERLSTRGARVEAITRELRSA